MAPIMEVLGPLLVALFVPQSPEDHHHHQQQKGLIASTTSALSLRHLMLGTNTNRFSRAQKLFTTGARSGCFHPIFASALTPHKTAPAAAAAARSSTLLSAAVRGVDSSSLSDSKIQFVTSSVLSLVYGIHGGGGTSGYSPMTTVTSLLDVIQKNTNAFVFMVLLALQFGLQPILTKKFTPKTVNRSTIVLTQEMVKFIAAGCILLFTGSWSDVVAGWDVKTSMMMSGLPAVLYSIQNVVTLIAYQNLDPLTFNVLNQTKTLSAALCVYLLMGKVQSQLQIVSLGILFLASCVIEKIVNIDQLVRWWTRKFRHAEDPAPVANKVDDGKLAASSTSSNHAQGVAAVLTASFISGLAGALTQKSLQGSKGRNSYLFTMELCVASIFFLGSSMLANPKDRQQLMSISDGGFFKGWTPQTIIPILTNAAGGIIVGLVTKYSGAVRKGFALIFGLLLSGILQARMAVTDDQDKPRVTKEQIIGGILAAISLWMHSSFPSR